MRVCGQNLKDEKIQKEGLWVSFAFKPDLTKFLKLYHQSEELERTALLKKASEVINSHMKNPFKDRSSGWEKDLIDVPSCPSQSVLVHAYLISNEENKAFQLAQLGGSLGWQLRDNPQPLFVAYCFARATKQISENLPSSLKRLWRETLEKTCEKGWEESDFQIFPLEDVQKIYSDLFLHRGDIDVKMILWCLKASQKRIRDIVGNQHRGAYGRAALLTGACVEVLSALSYKQKAFKFFNIIKEEFPRHSAFQSELKNLKLF
ncbi:MAG: hypothetical protein B7Y25_02715 [Alphaproteobacteria bacterium 16-39-46]|nr:MAG: hypothetical protein B7Y25_02715 [Alphaproteobacteria bacterium 16-39-46]OZA43552.1 MAG: hypothetical protein B7X84_02885 [Alphaproteobacteria bacterium 17-39-52]